MYPYGSYLAHYGIKGMKWGRRRYQNKDGSLTPAGRERYSEDSNEAYNLKRKGVDRLSNKELKRLNERLNLEQNYRRLNPSKVKRGAKIVAGVVGATTGAIGVMNTLTGAKNSEWFKFGKSLIESKIRG